MTCDTYIITTYDPMRACASHLLGVGYVNSMGVDRLGESTQNIVSLGE